MEERRIALMKHVGGREEGSSWRSEVEAPQWSQHMDS